MPENNAKDLLKKQQLRGKGNNSTKNKKTNSKKKKLVEDGYDDNKKRVKAQTIAFGMALLVIAVIVILVRTFFTGGETVEENLNHNSSSSSVSTSSPKDNSNDKTNKKISHSVVFEKPDEASMCGITDSKLNVFADNGVPCDLAVKLVEDTLAAETEDYDSAGFLCEAVDWYGYEQDEFTTSVQCVNNDGSKNIFSTPTGTTPVKGKPVNVAEFGGMNSYAMFYYFSIPDTNFQCAIFPALQGGRGGVGCHGNFDDSAKSIDGGNMKPDSFSFDEGEGLKFFNASEALYAPIDEEGAMVESKPLEKGQTIYAFGVGCTTGSKSLKCTVGDETLDISESSHKISKSEQSQKN